MDEGVGEIGFHLYDPVHLGWIVGIGIITFITASCYLRTTNERLIEMNKVFAITLIGLEITKNIYLLIVMDTFSIKDLPLHLCSFSMLIILLNAFKPSTLNSELLYSLVLPGALAALLFPNWTTLPTFSYLHNHSFIYHAMLIIYPLCLLFCGRIKPNYRQLPKVSLFLIALATPIYIFNKLFSVNFMFLNAPSPGSPLVYFEQWLGNPGYLLGFAGLIAFVWFLMYVPFFFKNRKMTL